ncbi:hypothetical protein BSF38_00017 [Paludisphaera borealis]|uniref:Uncharacterized protein n=2 Tax=Paludisphaera borealis TaxID=1387353 RepID=A0A1U7CI63_9BACT|nr:hypothetical protein BSF38_00017 [Paludisphaera borealis]
MEHEEITKPISSRQVTAAFFTGSLLAVASLIGGPVGLVLGALGAGLLTYATFSVFSSDREEAYAPTALRSHHDDVGPDIERAFAIALPDDPQPQGQWVLRTARPMEMTRQR